MGTTLSWDQGLEASLIEVQTDDDILREFFSIDDWKLVETFHEPLVLEHNAQWNNRGFDFCFDGVEVYTEQGSSKLSKEEFLTLMYKLFIILIDGANEEHHTVRYQPWWHLFVDNTNRIAQKLYLNS